MASVLSSTTVVFVPEIFDSQLVDPEQAKPVWPDALLHTQGDHERVHRKLGAILGAKKLRPGKIIEHFGIRQTWARLKTTALAVGFKAEQLVPLPYDWRRVPMDAVLDLKAFSPPGDGPVIVIGHGYGGLVAKALLQAKPSWIERVALVANLGVPHHGSDLDWIFALARPMGWISNQTWRVMCDPHCSVPTLSISAMTRPWAYGLPLHLAGVKELDVFSVSYPTLIRHPEGLHNELMVWAGDGFIPDLCMVRDEVPRLETDRFHADMPECPKFWRHLVRILGARLPKWIDPWASASIHLQRTHVPAGFYLAGLRFRGEDQAIGWIEAQEMTCAGGRFAPSDEAERGNWLSLDVTFDQSRRPGHYALFDMDELRKFVVLRLYGRSSWADGQGVPDLLDERLIFLSKAREGSHADELPRFHQFLGSAAHWRGQRPRKPRKWSAD
ncbi:hypothetical protein BH10PSE4_BH10PSE4_30140 [soil metagenome]